MKNDLFCSGDTATCLYNSPHEDDSLPRVLPGRLLTLDAQCRKDRGTRYKINRYLNFNNVIMVFILCIFNFTKCVIKSALFWRVFVNYLNLTSSEFI